MSDAVSESPEFAFGFHPSLNANYFSWDASKDQIAYDHSLSDTSYSLININEHRFEEPNAQQSSVNLRRIMQKIRGGSSDMGTSGGVLNSGTSGITSSSSSQNQQLFGNDLSQVDKDLIFEGLKKLYKKKVSSITWKYLCNLPQHVDSFNARSCLSKWLLNIPTFRRLPWVPVTLRPNPWYLYWDRYGCTFHKLCNNKWVIHCKDFN